MAQLIYYKFYVFFASFILLSYIGYLFSFRKNAIFAKRFVINISFSFINSFLIFIALGYVTFNQGLSFYEPSYGFMSDLYWPAPLKFLVGFVILDLVIYWQHRIFHQIPFLWRMHRLHHSDLDFDTSTGLRFHPFEALASLLIRLSVVYYMGISFFTLVVFEIVLNLASLFNHSNFSLPPKTERMLRKFIITPDLHRIHHSLDLKDSNRNFGFSVTLWDYLFKSYRSKSALDFKSENIGVLGYQSPKKQTFLSLLLQPFT